ncbi:MAG TPA: T9SS type A sorting domain-containing protein, partial [Chryseolinea sp.]|nr:T9SS type A sorting domain-containing protein [Chryseolinea sp.]
TKVEKNDTSFRSSFPYVQTPWPGNCNCAGLQTDYTQAPVLNIARVGVNVGNQEMFISTAPNPFSNNTMLRYRVEVPSQVNIEVYNLRGNQIKVLVNKRQEPGFYNVSLSLANLPSGVYMVKAVNNGNIIQTLRVVKN